MSMVERELRRQAVSIDPHLPATVSDLLYNRPADQFRVFVSSQMKGGILKDERAAAVEAISGIERVRPWAWENDAPVGMYHSEDICVEYARHSDMLVLILAGELTTPTRKEYKAAKDARAQCCIFAKSTVTQSDKVKRFISRERRCAITSKFANTSELKTYITGAILGHLFKAARTLQAHERILVAKRRARKVKT